MTAADEVARALELLGSAWRHNWRDFDGRTLQAQLRPAIDALENGDGTFDAIDYAIDCGICPQSGCWLDDCTAPHQHPSSG